MGAPLSGKEQPCFASFKSMAQAIFVRSPFDNNGEKITPLDAAPQFDYAAFLKCCKRRWLIVFRLIFFLSLMIVLSRPKYTSAGVTLFKLS